jgi:very-short-patch-repair endonuclease
VKKKHRWEAKYHDIYKGSGCPHCVDRVNGTPVSKPQRKLNDLLCGSLNYPEGRYRIDVAVIRHSQKIAVEYDCQYWHEGNEDYDKRRDIFLISRGWKILHVKSRNLLPTRKQLKKAINEISNKENVVNIFLEDWKTKK